VIVHLGQIISVAIVLLGPKNVLLVDRFPPPIIELTVTIYKCNWNIVDCGVKHHNPNPHSPTPPLWANYMYRIQYYWNKRSGPYWIFITGFFFPRPSPEYSCEKRNPLPGISNTGKFICFNNKVSNLYNNSVVEQIYCMAYIFTLLKFRKSNKTTINKNKTTNFYRSTSFRFSYIFRYFKVFQVKRIVYI
jgi:hypothetical protein